MLSFQTQTNDASSNSDITYTCARAYMYICAYIHASKLYGTLGWQSSQRRSKEKKEASTHVQYTHTHTHTRTYMHPVCMGHWTCKPFRTGQKRNMRPLHMYNTHTQTQHTHTHTYTYTYIHGHAVCMGGRAVEPAASGQKRRGRLC